MLPISGRASRNACSLSQVATPASVVPSLPRLDQARRVTGCRPHALHVGREVSDVLGVRVVDRDRQVHRRSPRCSRA
jgi:hypothetical protein